MLAARRAVLLGALAATAAAAAPTERRFRIMREGSNIGAHRVSFAMEATSLTARTEVDIAVKIAGFTVFRLNHRFDETWEGERLTRIVSRLDRKGKITEFSARAENGGLRLEGPDGARVLPANAAPLTWWDARRIDRVPLFANDTGRSLRLTWTQAARPGGGVRWRCVGDEEGEAGYGADGGWLDWQTRGEDGSQVTYIPA
jgi:hypothetical protein